MSEQLFLCFQIILLGAIILTTSNASELSTNETEARAYAQETSDKLFKLFDELRDEYFAVDQEHDHDDEYILKEPSFLINVIKGANKFDYEHFKDKELKYAFSQIIKVADILIIGGKQYLKIHKALANLELLLKEAKIQEYNETNVYIRGLARYVEYSPFIENVIATSNDTEELKYFWKEWRQLTGEWARENINLILEGIRNGANLTGQTPLDFWLREYNPTELENLMKEIQPLYNDLHAFIRNLLQKKYGESIVKSDGLIPHHIFEQVLAQTWTNDSIIEELYPLDNLPDVESVLQKRFKATELYEIADRFYQHLGFKEFPFQVWKDHIVQYKSPKTEYEYYDCSPRIYYSSPNIHLEYCEYMSFQDFLDAYIDMGKMYYAKEMTGLPAYFWSMHDLEYAVGKAVVLSTSTHHNLKAIGMILDFNFTQDVEMNRLLRKSIKSLLYIPVDFVHMKLMTDLLSGNVKLKELNSHYWKLMDKYVGVGPPAGYEIDPDRLDMPYYFYLGMRDNDVSRDFESEIISYQIYKKLCELSGKYPKEPLHLCDMHGSTAAGDMLKKMMRLGTSKPYTQVFATMFPDDPTASSEGILQYYSPVKELLVAKNKESNVKSGWKSSN